MDLSSLDYAADAAKGYTFNLVTPTGNVTDIKLTVMGDFAEEVQRHDKRKYLAPLLEKEKQKDKKDLSTDEIIADAEDKQVEGAVVRLIGWENVEWKGKALKFSKDNARMILKQAGYSWIVDQIIKESGAVVNFTQEQSKG